MMIRCEITQKKSKWRNDYCKKIECPPFLIKNSTISATKKGIATKAAMPFNVVKDLKDFKGLKDLKALILLKNMSLSCLNDCRKAAAGGQLDVKGGVRADL